MGKQKRKRLSRIPEEKDVITSPSLAGGGKKNPASMPGGSGILDEKEMPYAILTKENLEPNMEVEAYGTEDLFAAHYSLHHLFRDFQRGGQASLTVEDAVNLHARVVDELYERGKTHPPPPDDGLDDNSSTFERHQTKQPDWTKPVMKMIFSSAVEELTLSEREMVYHETATKQWEDDDVSASQENSH